jgi:hypothetical protein
MKNEELITLFFKGVLRREPDAAGLKHYTSALDRGTSPEQILKAFIDSTEFQNTNNSRGAIPHGHYYSPIPSTQDITQFQFDRAGDKPQGVDFRTQAQKDLLLQLRELTTDFDWSKQAQSKRRYYSENHFYGLGDALIYYGILKKYSPKRVIEIGSGFSSALLLDVRDRFPHIAQEITFVEPYPDRLNKLLRAGEQAYLLQQTVQTVPLAQFEQLEANDILFIDSSHVSKLGSDVNYLFFEVLPALKPGVLVHVHDIGYPFEYPRDWLLEGRYWNESYMLRAFLQFNHAFEIACFPTSIHSFEPRWFETHWPSANGLAMGHIWLQRV